MFPAYPFLALNAAISLHLIIYWFAALNPRSLLGKIPTQVKLAIILPVILLSINIGLLRVLGTVTAYRAPMQIYQELQKPGMADSSTTVCFGKDWYRFPTSFFLPNGAHAKFVNSKFDGLLPGEFHEGSSPFHGAGLIPPGMNDRNEEDPGKYIDIHDCSYLVDSHMTASKSSVLEPLYALEKDWAAVTCAPFLDTAATSLLARMIWIPDLPFIPERLRRVWGQHCLLRRIKG